VTAWLVVGTTGAATLVLKALGPALLGGRSLPTPLANVIALLAPTLLAALVATQVFAGDREIVLDARAVGLVAAALALVARLPILVVVVLAAAATAFARLLG
jgi:branched-subunit amino acid transport protein